MGDGADTVATVGGGATTVIGDGAGRCSRGLPQAFFWQRPYSRHFDSPPPPSSPTCGAFSRAEFLVMPMFFLFCALFPLTNIALLPRVMATIDPLFGGVDGTGTLLIDAPHSPTATDVTVLVAIAAAFLALGSCRFT